MTLDFHTADNAEIPHVVIYDVATGQTVTTIMIGKGLDAAGAAEKAAADFIRGFNEEATR